MQWPVFEALPEKELRQLLWLLRDSSAVTRAEMPSALLPLLPLLGRGKHGRSGASSGAVLVWGKKETAQLWQCLLQVRALMHDSSKL